MRIAQTDKHARRKPLRLWPGVVAAALLLLVRFAVPLVVPGSGGTAVLGGLAGALIVIVWWLFFSRAPWSERAGAIVLMVLAGFAAWPLLHDSIRNGMMGMMFTVFVIPVLSLALVGWAMVSRGFSSGRRWASMVAAVIVACGVFTVLRTEGITGDGDSDFEWRWTPTPEERLLAQARRENSARSSPPAPTEIPEEAPNPPAGHVAARTPAPQAAIPEGRDPAAARTNADPVMSEREGRRVEGPAVSERGFRRVEWPGFRGAARDGVIRGVRIETDWSRKPPLELWRRPIGPGWSSFAVSGGFVYTQEQRGDHEIVSCYRLSTGEPVWMHRDAVRFWESNGGAGPRATPAVHDDRVYTLGATGIVNALDARDGSVLWSRNAADDTGAPLPGWGFAGSPVLIGDLVIVAASGRLVGYEIATGTPRWTRTTGGGGYSSPHLATIDGVRQIVLLSGGGATSVAPADGTVLWQHTWQEGVSIVQPALIADGEVLMAGGDMMGGVGMRRLAVAHDSVGWSLEERWTTRGLKPYFNDFVVHEGHAFGFDGTILSCINLEDGERKWKGGRYGAGQMLLLPDQDLLLVLSEEGELALVAATPEKHTELARFKAIEGKTWNHPVLVADVLLVRNGEEMAAFQLSTAR